MDKDQYNFLDKIAVGVLDMDTFNWREKEYLLEAIRAAVGVIPFKSVKGLGFEDE